MRHCLLLGLLLSACGPGRADKGRKPGGGRGDDSDPGSDDTGTEPDSAGHEGNDTGEADVCAALGLTVRPWQEAKDDDSLGALAADLTLETTEGPWTLSEEWTGCEVSLFIPSQPRQATGWPDDLWSLDRDTADLFDALPPNTHLFFVASERAEEDRDAALAMIRAGVEAALDDMDEETAAWWAGRVHYLVGRDRDQPGWLGDVLQSPGWGVGIDRFQTLRYIGSFADPRRYNSSKGWFEPNLAMAQWEAVYYNFESDRQDSLDAQGAEVVRLFDGEVCAGSLSTEATLPDADALQAWDTLTVDLTMGCEGDGEYGDCPAWDYMAYLYACDLPVEDNPYASTPCQPAVPETLGACATLGTECRSDADCVTEEGETEACMGYVEPIAADTLTGICLAPTGEENEATYTCASDGSGYSDLACACSTEIGRWITTYHRIGRWAYDISPYLPLLARGGEQAFRFETNGPYELTLDLRFSNQGKDARPEEITHLFSGGAIYEGSNALYEPVTVTVPADAVKVELATVISGHGADANNCGEFCDMAHWFVINGNTDEAVVRSFPEAGSRWDCRDKVAQGTVPNQYGTWWYGRAGWCPGKEVPTEVADITDQVVPGAENTFEYYALYEGAEYTGYSTNRMNAWLVVSR